MEGRSPPWLERARVAMAVLCFAAAGGLVAWVLGVRAPASARAAAPAASVRIGETLVGPDADLGELARAKASEWEAAELTLELVGRDPIVRSRRAFGARVDVERLQELLTDAREPRSTLRRVHASLARGNEVAIAMPLVFDERTLFDELADLKDGYDEHPRDARADPRMRSLLPHRHGRTLDVHGTIDAIFDAITSGQSRVRARIEERPARRTLADLQGLRMDAVVGAYETRYNTLEEARDRTFNLRVAAGKLDGLVVLPGETFDFNQVVGERSQANGFRPAPVIAGGELVDGVGGGTCQVAGTLHAAAFFAGLPIVERSPHSRPSTYVFMGLDAVVSYPQLNLRFQNDLAFPIVIGFTVESGIVRVELRGASIERRVAFTRRVEEIRPYDEREVEDSTLPSGVRVLRQRGVAGFRVRTWRTIRDLATNQAVRTHRVDTYPPTQQIWRVGSGGAPPAVYVAPEGDTHAEYTADEYLTVVQGIDIEGLEIIRRAGRSGTPGWTARMGFPQVE